MPVLPRRVYVRRRPSGHQPTTTPAPTNAKTPSRAPDTPPGAAGGKAAPPLGKLRKAVRPPTQLNEKKAHVKDPNFGNRPRSLHHHRVGGRVWRGQTTSRVSAVLELEMGRTVAAEVSRVAGQKVAKPLARHALVI